MPFEFTRLDIPDVILVTPRAFTDERGFFMEAYKRSDFSAFGFPPFVQLNHSHSRGNVLRGLHFQRPPKAQGKLVYVVRGEILDVGVDLRRHSPTYGQWVSAWLSEQNHQMLYIPPGFAHGFYVTSDEADVLYQVTEEFSAEHDGGIRWNDPQIGVLWPTETPILSAKDARLPLLADITSPFD